MTIAFDIDGTVTLNPHLWKEIADKFRLHGHRVVYITGKEQPLEKLISLHIYSGDTFTCRPGEFKQACAERHGYNVDIWIDNEPGTIQPQRKLGLLTDTDLL